MNYEEMSDYEINLEVARYVDSSCFDYSDHEEPYFWSEHKNEEFNPCNNISDAWPIITENKITIMPDIYVGGWYARKDIDSGMDGDFLFMSEGESPLRSAMICFLKMKDSENEKNSKS